MSEYRLYSIDERGHVVGTPSKFEAESDAEALRIASEALTSDPLELWRGSTYLVTLTRNPAQPQSDCIVITRG